jgi:two-component system sensor histidine kinase UhpB
MDSLGVETSTGARPAALPHAGLGSTASAMLATAALAAAYYAGSRLEIALRIPGTLVSALSPANGVLLAALLVSPRRRWPLLGAGAAVAFLVANAGTESAGRVLLQLTHDLAICFAAAFALARLVPRRLAFDDLRQVASFLGVAVVVVPLVGAPLSPAVLDRFGAGDPAPLWAAWARDDLSDAVAILTLVPGLVLLLDGGGAYRAVLIPRRRALEAVLLAVALAGACAVTFVTNVGPAFVSPALLYAPVPFLLWAAARYRVLGAGIAQMGLAVVAAWAALHGRGLYAGTRDAFESVLDVQLFLVSIGVPLLLVASLLEERRRTTAALRASEHEARSLLGDLRQSFARIHDLAGRLIEAQERERSRVARDLHDDVNQQVAALAISLSSLKRRLPTSAPDLHEELEALQARTSELADAIRGVCRELHPALLAHAGVVAALRMLCAEIGRQHELAVRFDAPPDLSTPPGVALCLYRVAQEALRNAARHASARTLSVSLHEGGGQLELVVADDGRGIDLADARRRGGLGLVSLEERVRLAGGTLDVGARAGGGTEVRARVPASGGRNGQDEGAARG